MLFSVRMRCSSLFDHWAEGAESDKALRVAGELRWEKVKGRVQIETDVNGDGKADFSLTLKGVAKLATGDFFL